MKDYYYLRATAELITRGLSDTSVFGDKEQSFSNNNGLNITITQQSPDDNSNSKSSDHTPDISEFIAFLCWYLFLILCCVVPTICAYRRRRRLLREMAEGGAFATDPWMELEERVCIRMEKEKKKRLALYFVNYKMTVTAQDFCSSEQCQVEGFEASIQNSAENSQKLLIDHENTVLKLPTNKINGNRNVSGCCAVCLCEYEEGNQVVWSSNKECHHAFHEECILQWLLKKREPLCPCCRREFVNPQEAYGNEQDLVDRSLDAASALEIPTNRESGIALLFQPRFFDSRR